MLTAFDIFTLKTPSDFEEFSRNVHNQTSSKIVEY